MKVMLPAYVSAIQLNASSSSDFTPFSGALVNAIFISLAQN